MAEIQKLRFDNVHTELVVDAKVNVYGLFIPPLVIQPLIENAFEHAFNSSVKAPKITVAYKQEGNLLVCVVADNGVGMNIQENAKHNSKGLLLVKQRLQFLNSEYGTSDFSMAVNSATNCGTTISVTFPLVKNSNPLYV